MNVSSNITKGDNLSKTGKAHTDGRSNSTVLIKLSSAPKFKRQIEYIFVDQAWHFGPSYGSQVHLATDTKRRTLKKDVQ